ncbi:MAG: acyl-CoA thioester hydrolase [Pyrinomonadaceae bacterium]|nr:acyl-CoA thioester hydrolase [Pyrinomonadaceae bacterium]MDX6270701.1 acyl-CoA thioester hydrolase [Acidobacteriota bacterium]
MEELLKLYPVVIELPVVWGEMDALRHVNNIVYFRYFESARMAYFTRLDVWEYMNETGVGPILASTGCKFRLPLTYPDTVSVGTRVSEIGDDRFVMQYVVVSHNHAKAAAEGEGLVVSYDYRALKKAPLPAEMKRRIEALEQSVRG